MIQGYAIYLRTHRKTGKQYGGMCRWTRAQMTPAKACKLRWSAEDKAGIRGLFGGFDSRIVLSERRCDAPLMSDGLYHLRILADEAAVVENISQEDRLNLISPLLQVSREWWDEAARRENGRRNGRKYGRVNGHKCVAAKRARGTPLFTPEARKQGGLRQGPILGARMKREGRGIFAQSHAQRQANGHRTQKMYPNLSSENARKNKAARIGIFGMTHEQHQAAGRRSSLVHSDKRAAAARQNGLNGGRSGGLKGGPRGCHSRWHVARGIVNSNCELCVPKG